MRQLLAATAVALALVGPALAMPAVAQTVYGQGSLSPDPEYRDYQEYQRLVRQAEAYRLNEGQAQQQAGASQHAAIGSGASASDAAVGGPAVGTSTAIGSGAGLAARSNSCPGPGTDIAGGNWTPGEYCLPGGRN